MTAALAIWKIIKNPWVLVLIAVVAGMGGTGWYRMQWLGEKAARAADLASAQQAALQAQARDAAATAQIITAHQDELDKLKDQANARTIAIGTAPNGNGCVASQPMRAAISGLRASAPAAGDRDQKPTR